jgi:hypothetical protein
MSPSAAVGGDKVMFIVQTRRTNRTRKYAIAMAVIFVICGSLGALLTMHVYVSPPSR